MLIASPAAGQPGPSDNQPPAVRAIHRRPSAWEPRGAAGFRGRRQQIRVPRRARSRPAGCQTGACDRRYPCVAGRLDPSLPRKAVPPL